MSATDMRGTEAKGGGIHQISRQRRWQIKQTKKGKCMYCTAKRYEGSTLCRKHLAAARLRSRERQNSKPWKLGGPGRPPLKKAA